MKNLKLKNVKGTTDYTSKEQMIRNYISNTLQEIFKKYGYKPLSTSLLCYYDLLTLKYEKDNDILKEVYRVTDQAKRDLALRYDLTVPFAKYIAMNKNIKLPYKRYEIGKVFRDGPVKQGRMREFIQCDVDCVGLEDQMIEAELISLFVEGYKKLGIDVIIKYNNRKILEGIIEDCKIDKGKINQTITIIDKFEKLTKDKILEEFSKVGIEKEKVIKLIDNFKLKFNEIQSKSRKLQNIKLSSGIKEISKLNQYIEQLGLKQYVQYSSTLARGQEYYTGTVFEVYLTSGEIKSSIGGGGRYDNMIGDFIGDGKAYPAVGISFGLDVIFEILKQREEFDNNLVDVYIIPMENKVEALKIATDLRKQNMTVDIEMKNKKLKKSLDYVNTEKIPFVIILGDEEIKESKVIIKNMKTGKQIKVKIPQIMETIKNMKLNYKIFNPGGNKTALIIGNNYTQEERKKINNYILSINSEIEQVGFINQENYELKMSGGEFCANATRCAIYQYLQGKEGKIEIKVSGCKQKLLGGIDKENNVYVTMKINKKSSQILYKKGKFNFIDLDGILLVVLNIKDSKEYIQELKQNEEYTKLKLKEMMKEFETDKKAVGIILLEQDRDNLKINPIIWVKTINTLYYETACGSGSIATAIYKNSIDGTNNFQIIQPSGYLLNVKLNIIDDYLEDVTIKGKVIEE